MKALCSQPTFISIAENLVNLFFPGGFPQLSNKKPLKALQEDQVNS